MRSDSVSVTVLILLRKIKCLYVLIGVMISFSLASCSMVYRIDDIQIIPQLSHDDQVIVSHRWHGADLPRIISTNQAGQHIFIRFEQQNLYLELAKASSHSLRIIGLDPCMQVTPPVTAWLEAALGRTSWKISHQKCPKDYRYTLNIELIELHNQQIVATKTIDYKLEKQGSRILVDGI